MMPRSFPKSESLIVLAVAALAALAACAHNPEPRADPESAAARGNGGVGSADTTFAELTGRVTIGGTDRFIVITIQRGDGSAFLLTGGLLGELRTLGGAEVLARGVIDTSDTRASLDVREYELLAMDGQRPHVGVLLARGDELWLAGNDTLRLLPALDALREKIGAKIWVTGASDSTAKELRIASFGVIAPAP